MHPNTVQKFEMASSGRGARDAREERERERRARRVTGQQHRCGVRRIASLHSQFYCSIDLLIT